MSGPRELERQGVDVPRWMADHELGLEASLVNYAPSPDRRGGWWLELRDYAGELRWSEETLGDDPGKLLAWVEEGDVL